MKHAWGILLVMIGALYLAIAPPARADDIVIGCDTTALSNAITTANINSADDTITLAKDCIYDYSGWTPTNYNALPTIVTDTNHSLVINGNGAKLYRSSDSSTDFRFFQIASDAKLTLQDLRLVGSGFATSSPYGGAIYNQGYLTLTNVSILGCRAGRAGAIYHLGQWLYIDHSAILDNQASQYYGALFNGGPAKINETTIADNYAGMSGGGVTNNSQLSMTNVSLINNHDQFYSYGALHNTSGGDVSFRNTLIGGDNIWMPECANDTGATMTSKGFNLTRQGGGCPTDGTHDQTFPENALYQVVDAREGLVYPLLPDSPAIDAGYCPGEPSDQRYFVRPFVQPTFGAPLKDGCDIGAYEAHLEMAAFPRPNTNAASDTTEITLQYDQDISSTSVTTRAMSAYAAQTPLIHLPPFVDGSKLRLSGNQFHAGELVQVTALTKTIGFNGASAHSTSVWQFRTAADGSGLFTDTGQRLGAFQTEDIAAGDLNGDSYMDFIAANAFISGTVWLSLGGSGMNFTATQEISHATYAAVRLGDLDYDGDLDALFIKGNGEAGSVWLNNGQGHFSDSGQALSCTDGADAALGDFNADGYLDALIVDAASGQPAQVRLNDGTSLLALTQALPLGTSNNGVAADIGDLDGDGDLDLFILGSISGTVWLNDGGGTFAETSVISLSSYTNYDMALSDLDNDGTLDAYIARGGNDLVLLNRGDGHFTPVAQNLSAGASYNVHLGDVDGDGNLDAVLTNQSNNVEIWLGDGQGGFSFQNEFAPGAQNVALADVNGDDDLDLLIATSTANQIWANRNFIRALTPSPQACAAPLDTKVGFETTADLDGSTVYSRTFAVHGGYHGLMDGSYSVSGTHAVFTTTTSYLPGELLETTVTTGVIAGNVHLAGSHVWRSRTGVNGGSGRFHSYFQSLGTDDVLDVALGDLDGDGLLDAILATKTFADVVWMQSASTWYTMEGGWEGQSSPGVALGDMDNDGDLDALFAHNDGASELWFNGGVGDFNTSQTLGNYGQDVTVGDVDGDGDLDAVFANGTHPAQVWFNSGRGTMTLGISLTLPYTTTAVAMGDFDADGDLDLVFATGISSTVPNYLWYNDGHGNFPISKTLGDSASWGVAVGDVNCDGYPDIIFANHASDESNELWLNQKDGTFTGGAPLGQMPSTDVALGDVDADGDLDAVFSAQGTITHAVWLNTACGVFVPGQGFPVDAQAVALGDLSATGGLDILFGTPAGDSNSIWQDAARVTATQPPANDHRADLNSTLRLDYSAAIVDSTFTDTTVILYGAYHGAITGTINPEAHSFTPTQSLFPGELAQATAISNVIMYDDGFPVGLPYVWQYRARAGSGPGNYTRLQTLGVYSATSVALGDLDGDGDLDAFTTIGSPDRVWLNNGDGFFTTTGQLLGNEGSNDVALGDLDADGDLDAVVAGTHNSFAWFNDGSAHFVSQTFPSLMANAVALGDLDGDGDLDIFFAGSPGGSTNESWLNNGSGTFVQQQSFGSATGYEDVALGDLDGDGDLDAYETVYYGSDFVWLNDGHGNFYDSTQPLGSTEASYGVALGDVDNDGDLDAFIANDTDSNLVRLNNGHGCLTSTVALGDMDYGHAVALGDVDGDGYLDAFVGDISGQNSVLWHNDGNGHFSRRQELAEREVYGAAMGDLDGDGDLDIFVANNIGSISDPLAILKNTSTANLAILKTAQPSYLSPGQTVTYVLHLTNYGPGVATGVIVSDTLPQAFISSTVQSDVNITNIDSGRPYRWSVEDLPAGNTYHITITSIISPEIALGTIITNTASITSSATDTDTLDNRSQAVIQVQDQSQPGPFIVNTTDDQDDGTCGFVHCSLREAIGIATATPSSRNVISFAIPGPAPHVIIPQTPLPEVFSTYPIDIDARNANVVLSGTVVNHITSTLRVDDVALQLDGRGNVIQNGDFSTGLTHWKAWGDSCPVSRTVDDMTYLSPSYSYRQWTPACAIGNATFYDRLITPTLQADPLSPTSTTWITTGGSSVISLTLAYQEGVINVVLYALKNDDTVFPLTKVSYFPSMGWRSVSFTTTVPTDVKAVAFSFGHVLYPVSSGLVMASNDSNLWGMDIVGFPIGINVNGANIQIGGSGIGDGVMVGDSAIYGIHIKGSTNTVQGSFIGVGRDGLLAHPNKYGILVEGHDNVIGGARVVIPKARTLGDKGNILGYNDDGAIELTGPTVYSNTVYGNNIGVSTDGITPIPNGPGIILGNQAHNNAIGGNDIMLANIIAHNHDSGIQALSHTYGNSFRRNLIYGNGGMAIDLDADGPTPNDPGDSDDGANHLQNTPALLSATPYTATTVIKGRLESISNTLYTLDFYTNTTCASGKRGEARKYLGSLMITTTARGNGYFTFVPPVALPYGTAIAATATNAQGDTSELSECAIAAENNTSWPRAKNLDPLFTPTVTDTVRATVAQEIAREGESRWYKFTVTPNSQVVVMLTNLPANYDLTVYKDIAQAYTSLTGPDDLTRMSAEFAPDAFAPDAFAPDAFAPDAFAPDAFAPDAFAPDAFAPDAFAPDAFAPDAFAPDAFAPDAFANAQIRSLLGVSAFNGTTSEGLMLNTWNNTGDFYIRVRGRHGTFDPQHPYTLTVYVESSICNNVSASLPEPSTIPTSSSRSTLILTDFSRMAGSASEKSALQAKLAALAARPEVNGVIVDVGLDNRVIAANAQADAHPACPYAKNLVADSIKQIVDLYRGNSVSLKYIVLVGNDDVIPFFRYPDQAMLAGEQNYAPPVRDNTASQASLKLGYVLGQDEYGSQTSISFKSMRLPLPDLPVGRLVETPADIIPLLDAYLSLPGGVLTQPTSALVTGYDFLADDAAAVQRELGTIISGTVDTLIAPRDAAPGDPRSWSANDLKAKLLGQHYDLVFLAGHFSASSALAADYSTHLYTSDVLSATVSMSNTILFSAGCHSGYNIVNEHDVPHVTREPDWAQTFTRKGATLIGGTGYQYGDTDYIKYSERIYELFSHDLPRVGPVGDALVQAKQDYLAEIAELRGIQVKSYLEATLFGLPMFGLHGPLYRPARPAEETIIPALEPFAVNPGKTLGLDYADLTLTPTLTMTTTRLQSVDADEVYTATVFLGPDGVKSAPLEPVLPLALYNVTAPSNGMVLRGVGFRGGIYSDTHKVIPLTGAAATEVRGVHAPFRIATFFPVRPWNVNYFDALSRNTGDGATKLTLFPAQYRSTSPGAVDGTMRTFRQVNFRLYYSGNYTTYDNGARPALSAPPVIEDILSHNELYTVTFQAHIYGDPSAGIQEAWITYDLGDGCWRSVDMTQDSDDSLLWHATLTSTTGLTEVHYIIQAVNGVGLVTMDTNRGAYYDAGHRLTLPPSTPLATNLIWLTKPTVGAYSDRATFSLQLSISTSGHIPLYNMPIEVGLGAQRKIKITDPNGAVTVTLPLMGRPRTDQVYARFSGTDYFAPSEATTDITITKKATAVTLQPPSLTLTPTQEALITATLRDAGGRLLGNKQLFFVLQQGSQRTVIVQSTNYAGITTLSLPPRTAGNYTLTVHFGGTITMNDGSTVTQDDERYTGTQTSIPVTVKVERSFLYLPLIVRE